MDWLLEFGLIGSLIRTVVLIFCVVMVFNLMILVHEWGHFLAARWRGLHVDRFQIWFGKPIWKKTYNGVQYGLGSIPAGGFVSLPQMAPMESIEGNVTAKAPLPTISAIDKIIVAFAGPLFSFLLAAVFAIGVKFMGKPETESRVTTTIGYVRQDGPADKAGLRPGDKILEIDGNPILRFEGFVDSVLWAVISSEGDTIDFKVERPGEGVITIPVSSAQASAETAERGPWYQRIFNRPPLRQIGIAGRSTPHVGQVQEHSPAAQAGLKAGDKIIALNGQPVFSELQVQDITRESKDRPLTYQVERDGQLIDLTLTPRLPDERPGDWDRVMAGFAFADMGRTHLTYPEVTDQLSAASRSLFNMIQKLFSPKSEISPAHMSGPVGIAKVYYDLLERPNALQMVLWFSVLLNVNLAIMNLLPFPVLDGGHITMAIGEIIRGKPLQGRVLEAFQTACALLLFGFLIFVTLKDAGDIVRGIGKGGRDNEGPAIKWLPRE
jgi:regulator of sigma E protease